jgi:hypothetical protein
MMFVVVIALEFASVSPPVSRDALTVALGVQA